MASSIACSRTVDLGRYRQRFTGQTKKKKKFPFLVGLQERRVSIRAADREIQR